MTIRKSRFNYYVQKIEDSDSLGNIDDIENSLYFLCGPVEFVKNTIAMLESLGIKKEQIRTDVWGS